MPRNVWTITISGAGANRNQAAGDVDRILAETLERLREAGHDSLAHRITYDARDDGLPIPASEPIGIQPHAPGSVILDRGGSLRTADGTIVAITMGSVATPAVQLADGTVLVSVVTPSGEPLGTGTVTEADGSTLRLTMPPKSPEAS